MVPDEFLISRLYCNPNKKSFNIVFHFQFNDNKVDSWKEVESLVPLKNLETVYLERNPIYYDAGNQLKADPAYRRKIKLTLPWVKQIDATLAQ